MADNHPTHPHVNPAGQGAAAVQQQGGGEQAPAGEDEQQETHILIPIFSREFVQRCRENWSRPEFGELFTLFYQNCQFQDIQNRLQLDEVGGIQLALDVIRDQREAPLVGRAWLILQNFVLVNSVDDPEEMKPINIFVERGGVELAAIELNKPNSRWSQIVLTTLAWVSTNEKAVPRVIASGAHKIGIAYIRQNHPILLDISMSFIRSASVAPECRATLRADGALEAFLPFISCNRSSEQLMMRRGFRAASVVARLAGNDETGIGPSILRNNPDLIQTTLKIFDMVLDAGPDGTVINMLINPHFITMDLLVIATADVNKQLLIPAISVCMKALRLRGRHNAPMVSDIVKLFLQLSFEPACKTELSKYGMELISMMTELIPTPQQRLASMKESESSDDDNSLNYSYDTETIMAAQMLRNALINQQLSPVAAPKRPEVVSVVPGFVNRVLAQPSQEIAATIATSTTQCFSETAATNYPHVMISYSWQSSDLAKHLDELLRAQNIRVWIDYRCLDGCLSDSLERAASNAAAMIVLMTKHYKESAVCRREVEIAQQYGIPIIVMQAEDTYKPDGWLALTLAATGQTQAFPGWTLALIKSSMTYLLKRLASVAPSAIPPKQPAVLPSVQLQPSSEPRTGLSNEAETRILEALAALTTSVNQMRAELNELKMEIRGLRSI